MPIPPLADLLTRVLQREVGANEYILAAIDRATGFFRGDEGINLDYKSSVNLYEELSAAEVARDILAFSNTQGGLILFGVNSGKKMVGHERIDSALLRQVMGPYLGTRIDYEIGHSTPTAEGKQFVAPFILVPRCNFSYPTLLRKDIAPRGGVARKLKYLRGSLFYRFNDESRVEPTGGNIDEKAAQLGFSGASPRTRSSFVLEEDRPSVRLYAHINNRFFGREEEVSELVSKYDDARGRGVSIAGLGGIGKTELAIEIVQKLYKSGRFKAIYSGSSKRTVMESPGALETDPFFFDYPSFLQDLAAWLGIDLPLQLTLPEKKGTCIEEIKKLSKVLLFVDNLETIEDGRLFQFLDVELPENVWLLTTSRVHRVKNWVFSKQLNEMSFRDGAHLLRHELKRQGLEDFADKPIQELEKIVAKLQQHPLMIRWFAWTCRKSVSSWDQGPERVPREEIESFCVGQTLKSLPWQAQKILSSITLCQGQTKVTADCLQKVNLLAISKLEGFLYELESSGMISSIVNDQTGEMTYAATPLAVAPARDLARQNHWEQEIARGLSEHIKSISTAPSADPLIRDLVDFDPRKLKTMQPEEIADLRRRVERANQRPHGYKVELLALAAECERHSRNIFSADELYKNAGDQILRAGTGLQNETHARILMEAATVAKMRGQDESQVRRAISYLESIQQASFAPLRVLGMLTELHALLGDEHQYAAYKKRVTNLRDKEMQRFSYSQVTALDEALVRAEESLARSRRRPS